MNNDNLEQNSNSNSKSEPPSLTNFNNDLQPVINQLANEQVPGIVNENQKSREPFSGYLNNRYKRKAVIYLLIQFSILILCTLFIPIDGVITFIVPLIFIFMYGSIILFFKKDQPPEPLGKQHKSYQNSMTFLIIGLAFCFIVYRILFSPDNDGSGIEGLAALPWLLAALISFLISFTSLVATFIDNKKDGHI